MMLPCIVQAMTQSGNSKVIFVPVQLQSDVIGQLVEGSAGRARSDGGEGRRCTPTYPARTGDCYSSARHVYHFYHLTDLPFPGHM
jgi:hypothetical protein